MKRRRSAGLAAGREAHATSPRQLDLRWDGHVVRVTTPAPTEVWADVAKSDPTTLPFQTPRWRDCVVAAAGWQDTSRLYELPGGRELVLMMARRRGLPGFTREMSWPPGWGTGGVLAPGGVKPEEVALVQADLARSQSVSVSVRPGFAAAPAWQANPTRAFTIPRAVHVAEFAPGESFEDYWERSVPRKARSAIRNARRHLDAAGVTVSAGNSPEQVGALLQVYSRWIEWRAGQRRMPAALARWQARIAEPPGKYSVVAGRLGDDCRIWVAWWDGRPIAASVSLYAYDVAVGWRTFTDRAVPARFRLAEVLAAEALRHAMESGCRALEMGESVGRRDLASFKERLGGTEHPLNEYCFEWLPLSPGRVTADRVRRRAERWVVSRAAAHRERHGRPVGALCQSEDAA